LTDFARSLFVRSPDCGENKKQEKRSVAHLPQLLRARATIRKSLEDLIK